VETQAQTFRVIGRRTPKVDALDKVTGRAQFGADVALPRMLVGKVLRSPYAHARITRIDTSKAQTLPGVKTVITGDDLPRVTLGASEPGGHCQCHLSCDRRQTTRVANDTRTSPLGAEASRRDCELTPPAGITARSVRREIWTTNSMPHQRVRRSCT